MNEKKDKSDTCSESDTADPNRTRCPIPATGIGHRIGQVAELVGTRTSAYTVMGVSSAALQRYIKEENEPPFAALARLCVTAQVRLDWLATGEGPMRTSTPETAPDQASQPVRQETLMIALQLTAEALGNKTLPPAKHAELVSLIYEMLDQGLPEATVLRFARVAA